MPRRDLYTREEVTLCTYAALHSAADFGGEAAICRITGRSIGSIKMKIWNIAAMLDEEHIARNPTVHALSGRPPGESGRRTNWDWVAPLARLSRAELLQRCQAILAAV